MENSQDIKMEDLINSADMKFLMDDLNVAPDLPEDELIPEAYDAAPSNENYDGVYKFDVFVPPSKNTTYSPKLKKLYVKMSTDFTMQYKCTYPPGMEFFVRAKPKFCQPEEALKPVKRCVQHIHDQSNIGYETTRHHVLRCKTTQAKYQGGRYEHCSVLAPLLYPEVGTDTVSLTYQFVCQNSCSGGMNRRAIEIIFTLEDIHGAVYGRSSINVRICSCPKRDKEKEESELKDQDAGAPPPGKKRKMTKRPAAAPISLANNDELVPVNIHVVGQENRLAILKYAYQLHAANIARGVANPQLHQECMQIYLKQENDH